MSQNSHKRIVQSYLSFEGRREEALDFYRKTIGSEVTTLLRYKDSSSVAGIEMS
jgi:PhnB protein